MIGWCLIPSFLQLSCVRSVILLKAVTITESNLPAFSSSLSSLKRYLLTSLCMISEYVLPLFNNRLFMASGSGRNRFSLLLWNIVTYSCEGSRNRACFKGKTVAHPGWRRCQNHGVLPQISELQTHYQSLWIRLCWNVRTDGVRSGGVNHDFWASDSNFVGMDSQLGKYCFNSLHNL